VALADEAGEGGLTAGRAGAEAASAPLDFAVVGASELTAGSDVAEQACCW
jgi:hypothetical protein